MKQQDPQPQIDLKTYNDLMVRRRAINKEIEQIKSMTYHELIDKNRKKQPILPPSPTKNFMRQQLQNQLRASGFNDVEEIADRQLRMIQEVEKNNIIKRRQMRQAPIWSQIKRGSLGMDGILILFGIFGSIALPFIFYQRFKKNKETIINSRSVPPEVIQNLTEDSDINIDDVSEQSIHYDNPERRRKFKEMMEKAEKMSSLKKDLDL